MKSLSLFALASLLAVCAVGFSPPFPGDAGQPFGPASLQPQQQQQSMVVDQPSSRPMPNADARRPDHQHIFSLPLFVDILTNRAQKTAVTAALGLALTLAGWNALPAPASAAAAATDPNNIVLCLFQKCTLALGQCIANPNCLANVICINTCTGRPDEIDCQINCGTLFENTAVAQFNKCVISDMNCVPKRADDGSYPIPTRAQVASTFETKLFNGRWYITAGQNPLFDIFPCQVHFFTETEPGKVFAKINWRVEEPDGEFFNRDTLQEFVQDKTLPSHLVNDNNEYLHYSDDWWIIDYEYDNNPDKVPPFVFVYYRGNNDAWEGYGGAVVYTRAAQLPTELLPRLRAAAAKVNFDFDKDFTLTDNSCPAELSEGEKTLLREKFIAQTALQTANQVQAEATRLRGNAVNSLKAQELFFENRLAETSRAFGILQEKAAQFEQEQTINSNNNNSPTAPK